MNELRAAVADRVILGCTELPLVVTDDNSPSKRAETAFRRPMRAMAPRERPACRQPPRHVSRVRVGTILVALVVLSVACACGPLGGIASFWKGYRSDLIVKQHSDQGPWGGHRWIHWDSADVGTFSEADVIEFARDNGWRLLERREVSSSEMSGWIGSDGSAMFPLLFPKYYGNSDAFRRHISRDSVVLKFESGWMREDPETMELCTAHGYVQVSRDGQQMAIYHLWGG